MIVLRYEMKIPMQKCETFVTCRYSGIGGSPAGAPRRGGGATGRHCSSRGGNKRGVGGAGSVRDGGMRKGWRGSFKIMRQKREEGMEVKGGVACVRG